MARGKSASETGRITRGGNVFVIYDAFPTKALAKKYAKDLRSYGDQQVRVHDMGKNAGRLRHGLFVRNRPKSTRQYAREMRAKKPKRRRRK